MWRTWIIQVVLAFFMVVPAQAFDYYQIPEVFWGFRWGESKEDVQDRFEVVDLHLTSDMGTNFYTIKLSDRQVIRLTSMKMFNIVTVGFWHNQLRRVSIHFKYYGSDGIDRWKRAITKELGNPVIEDDAEVLWSNGVTTLALSAIISTVDPNDVLIQLDFTSAELNWQQKQEVEAMKMRQRVKGEWL